MRRLSIEIYDVFRPSPRLRGLQDREDAEVGPLCIQLDSDGRSWTGKRSRRLLFLARTPHRPRTPPRQSFLVRCGGIILAVALNAHILDQNCLTLNQGTCPRKALLKEAS